MKFLAFIDEAQFQKFASQLLGAESDTYQPVEGSGGDGGFDGMDGETAYQIYFPEPQNRKELKYISKIDEDLKKVIDTAKQQSLKISRWVLVVPTDMRQKVIAHLQKVSTSEGIQCIYWGSTKIEELVSKHPHIRNAYPEAFLPDVQQGVADVMDGIAALHRNASKNNVEIVTDTEFQRLIRERRERTRTKIRTQGNLPGSAAMAAGMAFNNQGKREEEEIKRKKAASDRMYQVTKDEINQNYDERIEKAESSLQVRGMLDSTIGKTQLERIEASRKRTLERLDLEYGKQPE